MLTVKHISIGGNEMMIPAARVWFYPQEPRSVVDPHSAHVGGMVTVVPPTAGPHEDLQGGTVFVMNETGKTISRYDLGASPVPL